MADEEEIQSEAPDLGAFVPETFKGEDGTFDTAGFRTRFDELAAFKAEQDDLLTGLPESPDGYVFSLPEEHALPEGFDPVTMKTKDENGNDVEFNPAAMIDPKDPDVGLVQQMLHEIKAPPAVMKKIAGIMVNREIRSIMEAQKAAGEQMKALGPDAQSRIDTVKREVAARVPPAQAAALMDSLTSADAVRAVTALISKSKAPPAAAATGGPDYSNMTPQQKILAGLQARSKGA